MASRLEIQKFSAELSLGDAPYKIDSNESLEPRISKWPSFGDPKGKFYHQNIIKTDLVKETFSANHKAISVFMNEKENILIINHLTTSRSIAGILRSLADCGGRKFSNPQSSKIKCSISQNPKYFRFKIDLFGGNFPNFPTTIMLNLRKFFSIATVVLPFSLLFVTPSQISSCGATERATTPRDHALFSCCGSHSESASLPFFVHPFFPLSARILWASSFR